MIVFHFCKKYVDPQYLNVFLSLRIIFGHKECTRRLRLHEKEILTMYMNQRDHKNLS